MNMSEFFDRYGDEVSCKAYFRQQREKDHTVCKRCTSPDLPHQKCFSVPRYAAASGAWQMRANMAVDAQGSYKRGVQAGLVQAGRVH